MSIEEQIEQALAEGRCIKRLAHNLFWFVRVAAQWTISADLRAIAFAIAEEANGGKSAEALAYRCYDLAVRVANDEIGTYVGRRAIEVIYQVRVTCEI